MSEHVAGRKVVMSGRLVRAATLALVTLMSTAACIGQSSPSSRSDSKTVYFLSWGGSIQDMLEKQGWAEKFHQDTGYKVVLVPKATSDEIVATAIAQKKRPQVDVVMCDYSAWLRGLNQKIFAPISPDEVPNVKHLYDIAKVKRDNAIYGAFPYGDVVGFLYQSEVFEKNGWKAPKSWDDLFRPEFKGKLIIPPPNNTYGMYTLIQLAKMSGGDEQNIAPGFKALKRLAPGILDYTTTYAKIGQLMQSEDAALAVFARQSAFTLKRQGIPVDFVTPDPAYISPTAMGLVKDGPNAKGARVFMNWFLSKKVLSYRATKFFQTPMTDDVDVTGPAKDGVVLEEAEIKKLAVIDYSYATAHQAEWMRTFSREVAPVKGPK